LAGHCTLDVFKVKSRFLLTVGFPFYSVFFFLQSCEVVMHPFSALVLVLYHDLISILLGRNAPGLYVLLFLDAAAFRNSMRLPFYPQGPNRIRVPSPVLQASLILCFLIFLAPQFRFAIYIFLRLFPRPSYLMATQSRPKKYRVFYFLVRRVFGPSTAQAPSS